MKPDNNFEYISSKDNSRVKLFSKLSNSKYRDQNRQFLAEGIKLTREAVSAGCAHTILVRETELESGVFGDILSEVEETKVLVLSDSAFAKITTESAPQGIITVVNYPDFHVSYDGKAELYNSRCIALDSVRDPGNMGTIMRSALAFGFDTVIVGNCVDIYNTKTVRASMGAMFHTKIVFCDDLADALRNLSSTRRIIGAALKNDCMTLGEYETEDSDIVVIGNEGSGITDSVMNVCTHFAKISMGEMSESLNAAVAASVFMWEYSKKD